jgi:hypothetical protein
MKPEIYVIAMLVNAFCIGALTSYMIWRDDNPVILLVIIVLNLLYNWHEFKNSRR